MMLLLFVGQYFTGWVVVTDGVASIPVDQVGISIQTMISEARDNGDPLVILV
jgi:hypothetical protein